MFFSQFSSFKKSCHKQLLKPDIDILFQVKLNVLHDYQYKLTQSVIVK